MNRWEAERKIILQAVRDPKFKEQLFARPKETIKEFLKNEKEVDFALLEKLDIKVAEEKKGEWILALPSVSKELSDEELEKLLAGAETYEDYGNAISSGRF